MSISKLEVGKTYMNNVGEQVTIKRHDKGYSWPYIDDKGKQYDMRGNRPGRGAKYLVKEIKSNKEQS